MTHGRDVGEETQDASAVGGRRRKGVHVQQLVVLQRRIAAPDDLDRTIARARAFETCGIGGEELGHQSRGI